MNQDQIDPQDAAEAAAAAGAESTAAGSSVDATVPEGMNPPAARDARVSSPVSDDDAKTPPPLPAVPSAAPAGTISRDSGTATPAAIPHAPGSAGHAPPAPPLAAVLARGSAAHPPAERRAAAAGTDFLRSLRAVPEGQRTTPSKPLAPKDTANSAADRSNATQTLTEADLAAITVSPPPPPASPGQTGKSQPPPPPPARLPGATPPKSSNR